MEATITSLDGGRVSLSGEGLSLAAAGASRTIVWEGSLGQFEFSGGDSTYADDIASREGIRLNEKYRTLEGETIRLGDQTVVDPYPSVDARYKVAVWYGLGSTVMTWVPNATSSDALNVVGQFAFFETDSGAVMSARPRSDFRLGARPPRVMAYERDLGHIEVFERTAQQDRVLPTTDGAKSEGGDLYVEEKQRSHGHVHTADGRTLPAPETTDITLLLVAKTSVCRVYNQVASADESALVRKASRLMAEWTPAEQAP